MRIFLRTFSTNEDWNGDCDYAVVDVTPELAAIALRRVNRLNRIQAKDDPLVEMYYWDHSAVYFACFDWFEEIEDPQTRELVSGIIWNGDPWIETSHVEIPESAIPRTEGKQMIVRDDAIAWACYPKHSDVQITTAEVPLDVLKQALQSTPAKSSEGGA